MYGRPNKGVGASRPGGGGARSVGAPPAGERFDPLTVSGCFNCNHPGHTMRDCHKPVNATLQAQRKLDYFAKKRGGRPVAAAILYALCRQLDSAVGADGEMAPTEPIDVEDVDEDDDEAAVFEALMVTDQGASHDASRTVALPPGDDMTARRAPSVRFQAGV